VTFRSGLTKTRIDYFLIRADSRRLCKAIPNKYLGTQHRLLVLDVELKCSKWKRSSAGKPRVKWSKLTKKNAMKLAERISEGGVWKKAKDANIMWGAMAKCIRRSAKEILSTSRKGGNKMKGAWG